MGRPTLAGAEVTLRPFEAEDAGTLFAARDEGLLAYLPSQGGRDAAGFAADLERLAGAPDVVLFTVLVGGRAAGVTSYLDIRPRHRGLEIGHTWIARAHHGTRVNPEMKLLLLEHAFERLGCVRVQLKTDARNAQSRRAIEKLGAVREGVLRRHMILPDGFVRATVLYSITDAEWAGVRAGLEARLGRSIGRAGGPVSGAE